MMQLETFVRVAGVFQFGLLAASASVPGVLNWREQLRRVDPLLRHLVWVHGAYVVLMIVGLAAFSLTFADVLTGGTPVGRALAAFIALFWGLRLAIQGFIFDARPYLTSPWRRLGYHGLTAVFAYLTIVFVVAAIR